MSSTGNHLQASITVVMGASGSGKSIFIKGDLRKAKPPRLMVWDFKREYAEFGQVFTDTEAVRRIAYNDKFRVVFQPSHDTATARKQFDTFCRIAYAAKRLHFVGEELAFVTSASYAPPGWSMLTLAGRSEGLIIYGASQRPAAIDKNFFGSASTIRTGRLNFKNDQKVLADVLQVPLPEIQALKPLQFIARDMNNGTITRGKQKPPRS